MQTQWHCSPCAAHRTGALKQRAVPVYLSWTCRLLEGLTALLQSYVRQQPCVLFNAARLHAHAAGAHSKCTRDKPLLSSTNMLVAQVLCRCHRHHVLDSCCISGYSQDEQNEVYLSMPKPWQALQLRHVLHMRARMAAMTPPTSVNSTMNCSKWHMQYLSSRSSDASGSNIRRVSLQLLATCTPVCSAMLDKYLSCCPAGLRLLHGSMDCLR